LLCARADIAQSEVEFPIQFNDSGSASGDSLFAAVVMAKFALGVVSSGLVEEMCVCIGELRVMEVDKLARKALVIGEDALHFLCSDAAVLAELA
jgi:hypothetical protein